MSHFSMEFLLSKVDPDQNSGLDSWERINLQQPMTGTPTLFHLLEVSKKCYTLKIGGDTMRKTTAVSDLWNAHEIMTTSSSGSRWDWGFHRSVITVRCAFFTAARRSRSQRGALPQPCEVALIQHLLTDTSRCTPPLGGIPSHFECLI